MTDPVENIVAGAKLQQLMETPDTEVKRLSDGGVRVGKFISLWKRLIGSTVLWIQAAAGVFAALWLAIPQETFMALVPAKYVAWGTIIYAIVTALARMRSI